jgi:cytochrome b pre-mRNA-processing protein 3
LDTIFRRAKGPAEAARKAYKIAVTSARSERFYRDFGVPDSVDGRFEMIVLHVILIVHRLRGEGGDADLFVRALIEALFDDMDRSLREMGVGDLSVGKKVKQMAAAFYGHASAYDDALATKAAGQALPDALRRNVFGTSGVDDESLCRLAAAVRLCVGHLEALESGDILAGKLSFA